MTTTMTLQDAEQRAHVAVAIVRGRIVAAVRFAEAYEPSDRVLVVDGSQYSPSTRALPGAESIYQASYAAYGLWEAFEAIADRIEEIEVPESTDSECPRTWSVGWEDGCLWAYSPDYEGED